MTKNNKIILASVITIVITLGVCIALIINHNKKEEYTVIFMNDGITYKEVVVTEGDYLAKPSDPTKAGYDFIEWQYNGRIFDFSTPITDDMILRAKWEKKKENVETIVVKFDTDGGTTYPNKVIEKGKKVEKPKDPVKEGYTFKKWVVDGKEFNFNTTLNKNTTIKAIWEKKEEPKEEKVEENSASSNDSSTTDNSSTSNSSSDDEVINVAKPTLSLLPGTYGGGQLSITEEGAYAKGTKGLNGWTLYVKENGTYTKMTEQTDFKFPEITVQPGQEKVYVVKVFVLDSKGNKVYSAYSNEITIKREIYTPTLSTMPGTNGGTQLSITKEGTYTSGTLALNGWALYVKENGTYTKMTEQTDFNFPEITLEPGQERVYAVKVYVLDSKGNKVYSEYSNDVTIKNEVLTPTLSTMPGTNGGIQLSITEEGAYANGTSRLDGWALYIKENGEYTKMTEQTDFNFPEITLNSGLERVYAVRVYVLDSKGNKVYSAYSNDVTITSE